jgi:hypothetical protein
LVRWCRENYHTTLVELATTRIRAMGIRDRPTSFRAPWQNGYVERLIGSVRRECTDHMTWSMPSTFDEFLQNMQPIIMTCKLTFRLGRTRPPDARSNASEMLLHIGSSAGFTIDTHESSFRKRQVPNRHRDLKSATNIPSECRIAIIGSHDAMILPYDANPGRIKFRKGHGLRTRSQHGLAVCRFRRFRLAQ